MSVMNILFPDLTAKHFIYSNISNIFSPPCRPGCFSMYSPWSCQTCSGNRYLYKHTHQRGWCWFWNGSNVFCKTKTSKISYWCSFTQFSLMSCRSIGVSVRGGVGGGSVWLCWEFRQWPVLSTRRPHPDQPAHRCLLEPRQAQRQRGHVPQSVCWELHRYEVLMASVVLLIYHLLSTSESVATIELMMVSIRRYFVTPCSL